MAERRISPTYSGQFRLTETFRSNLLNETSFNIDELGESEIPTILRRCIQKEQRRTVFTMVHEALIPNVRGFRTNFRPNLPLVQDMIRHAHVRGRPLAPGGLCGPWHYD